MMKHLLTALALFSSTVLFSQTICGTAGEGGAVTLTAPAGYVISSIDFASYGTPNGSCGSFTIGGCHAANSQSICESVFLGQNSASINATNGVFGDPCSGTVKRLYIQATYSSTLPLTLVNFSALLTRNNMVQLDWETASEVNTSHFVIEKSTDGTRFDSCGSVLSRGQGAAAYQFVTNVNNIAPVYYFRLQMVDRDGQKRYSDTRRVETSKPGKDITVFPTVTADKITISGYKAQDAVIFNNNGQQVKKIQLNNGIQSLDISSWQPGLYILKTSTGAIKFIKQ